MIEGDAVFAVPTHGAGRRRSQSSGVVASPSAAPSADGSGAPSSGRRNARRSAALLYALAGAFALALSAAPAQAAYLHNTVVGEYGKEGPKASGTSGGCRVEFHDASDRIYYFADGKIYGLHRTAPGSVTALGGAFPINAGIGSSCGDPDLTVDNSGTPSSGNIYAVPSNTNIYGWNSAGAALPGFPVSAGGETCGVAATNNGQVWGGTYGSSSVTKFTSSGASAESLALGYTACKLAVDPSNNDLYVQPYNGSAPIWKYTAASNYATKISFPSAGSNNPDLTINGATDRLYVANGGSTVKAYDTTSGSLVEQITPGGNINSVSVEESTDTLFVAPAGGAIKEVSGAIVPDIVTGDPVGNKDVSGSVDDAGGGPITQCYFEWGTDTKYEGGQAPCSPAPPFGSNPQAVTANIPSLEGEVLYHYRLVAHNANGKNNGGDKTIEPHNVEALTTTPATNITRTTAQLNGTFEGTNEATSYYFEWEQNTTGGPDGCPCANSTPVKNVPANITLNEISDEITGLTAGKKYIFRVVAENSKGVSKAQTVEFTTAPPIKGLTTLPATGIVNTEATLNGSLDPDGYATTYYFEWGKDTTYGQTEPLPPGLTISDTSPGDQDVSVLLTDLEPGTEYHYRLTATNSLGTTVGGDQSFTTPQPPSITSFNAINLTATSADLVATINPNGYATQYWFEYGTTTAYGTVVPIPNGELPPETTVQSIEVPISGLEERTYHFRLTAKSQRGTVVTEDQSFNFNLPESCPNKILRQETGSAYVPDCRAYELVSARNTNGTALFAGGPTSPTANGKFGYTGFLNQIPNSGEPQATAFGVEPYLATRKQNGWETKYIGVSGSKAIAQSSAPGNEYGAGGQEFRCWYEEEEQWSCGSEMPDALPHDDSLEHILVWNRFQTGILGGPKDGTNGPEVYDNEGRPVGQLPTNMDEIPGAEKTLDEGGWIGSARINADYTHYAFSSIKAAFAPGGLVEPPGSVYDNNIQTGEVSLVSKRENGEDIKADPKSPLTEEFLRVPGISDDGSHILISSAAAGEQIHYRFTRKVHLYMAVNEGNGQYAHYDISIDKNGKDVGVLYAEDDMSTDGSKVFFITAEQMTDDDTDTSRDLFEWNEDRAKNGGEPLARVSIGNNGAGDTDECDPVKELKKNGGGGGAVLRPWTEGLQGEGLGLADCSVRLPFIWPGQGGSAFGEGGNLYDTRVAGETGEIYFYSPERLDGARGFPNKRNLYVWRDGRAQFVATFEPSMDASRTAKAVERINVSPDGSNVAFITRTQLTGYDNAGKSMMYHYDPAARAIKCVSCRPDGAPPISDAKGSTNGLFMSNDGRTFWSTEDSLTPRDANENIDVYEFTEGRPQLITTGTSDDAGGDFQPPGLVGVTANGVDVFFATYQRLVEEDENGEQLKFYDARTSGGFAPQPLNPPCQAADECHGEVPAGPANPKFGSTAPLGDGGNWKSAGKKKHKRHGKCKRRKGGKAAKTKCRSKQKKAAKKGNRRG